MTVRVCVIGGCGKTIFARTWCVTHYHRWHRTGDPLKVQEIIPKKGKVCSIAGCGRPAAGRGWCQGHYRRWTVHGDPLVGGPLVTKLGPQPCPVAGCTKLTRRNGLCTAHDQRLKNHGTLDLEVPVTARGKPGGTCAGLDCSAVATVLGWCRFHYVQHYRQLNQEQYRQASHRRRVCKRGNAGGALPVSDRDWRRMLAHYRHSCTYCGRTDRRLEVEHVIPISRGGRHAIGNLVPACGPCNQSKGDRLLVEWRYARKSPRYQVG